MPLAKFVLHVRPHPNSHHLRSLHNDFKPHPCASRTSFLSQGNITVLQTNNAASHSFLFLLPSKPELLSNQLHRPPCENIDEGIRHGLAHVPIRRMQKVNKLQMDFNTFTVSCCVTLSNLALTNCFGYIFNFVQFSHNFQESQSRLNSLMQIMHIFPMNFECFHIIVDACHFRSCQNSSTRNWQHGALHGAHVHEASMCVMLFRPALQNKLCVTYGPALWPPGPPRPGKNPCTTQPHRDSRRRRPPTECPARPCGTSLGAPSDLPGGILCTQLRHACEVA